MSGIFIPVGDDYYGVHFGTLSKETKAIDKAFASQQHKMVCINDSVDVTEDNFCEIKAELDSILNSTFPEKSSFEK